MPPSPPAINFAWLAYPSDRITIQALRARNPDGFYQEEPAFFEAKDWGDRGDFGALLALERIVAHKAYAVRLGLPDPHAEVWTREELVELLWEGYKSYGLSSGPQHTEQMVRDLEAQAVAQAEKHLGMGR